MGLLRLAQFTPEIAPGASVTSAIDEMVARKVGAIAVVEERRIVGIFTERDLMKRVVHAGKDLSTTPIRDVMTAPVITVLDSTPVAKAAALMRHHHIRHLAILDGKGELAGVVALRHLLYDLMNDLEIKVGDLEGFLMTDGPGG